MIVIHASKNDPFLSEVAHQLKEMSAAFRVEYLPLNGEGMEAQRPYLEEGNTIVKGEEEIRAYVVETGRLLRLWSSFQSDSCEIDEDGNTC